MPYSTDQYIAAIQAAEAAGDKNAARALTRAMSQSMAPTPGRIGEGAAAMIAQGATLGLSSLLPAAREAAQRYQEEAPGAATALEMAGGLMGGLGIGAGLGLLGRAPGAAGAIGRTLGRPTIPGQAALGATEGAVYGAATAEPGQRLGAGGVGAALGGIGGGVSAPLVGAATRRLTPGMQAERILETNIARDIGRRPTAADYAGIAERAVQMPELTLAEIPGATTQALARTMTALPSGAGMETAQQVLRERSRTTPQRLIGKLRELTGAEGDYYENLERLGRQRSEEAAPLYQAAYEAPFEVTEETVDVLERLRGTPWLRPAYNKARTMAWAEDKTRLPPWNEFAKQVEEAEGYDLEVFDWLKRGLDAQYQKLVRQSPDEARTLWGLRQQMVGELDQAVPAYAAARRAYAGPTSQMEAQEAGRSILKEEAGATRELVTNMSEAEREAYTLGATEAITTRLRSRPRQTGGVPSIPEYVEERLRWAFPSEDAFQEFLDTMDVEAGMQGFKNMLLGRSPTADILTGLEDVQRIGGLGRAGAELMAGNLGAAAQQAMATMRPPRTATLPEGIADPLVRMLFSQGPGVAPVLQRLQRPPIVPRLLGPVTTTQAAMLMNQLQQ